MTPFIASNRLASGPPINDDRDADQEPCVDLRTILCREPYRYVKCSTGEEAGFRYAEQEAQQVEAVRPGSEYHGHGDESPTNHDPRKPDTRSEAIKGNVAGHLEEAIAEEQDSGAVAECGRA